MKFYNLTCANCEKSFQRTPKNFKKNAKLAFCNNDCQGKYKAKIGAIKTKCDNCNKFIIKNKSDYKKSKKHFCSHSCRATFQNNNRNYGYRRSKLEIWLEKQLTKLYPNLEIHYNNKHIINSELDIYVPSLKLAFELNGIFHYEPIFGREKLDQIQNNDDRKFQACIEKGISLCIIDTSSQKRFTEKSSQKFLDIIINIINTTFLKSAT